MNVYNKNLWFNITFKYYIVNSISSLFLQIMQMKFSMNFTVLASCWIC